MGDNQCLTPLRLRGGLGVLFWWAWCHPLTPIADQRRPKCSALAGRFATALAWSPRPICTYRIVRLDVRVTGQLLCFWQRGTVSEQFRNVRVAARCVETGDAIVIFIRDVDDG